MFWSREYSKNPQNPVVLPPESYRFSEFGNAVFHEIQKLNSVYKNVRVDLFCIMPDHIHMIIVILPLDEQLVNIDGRSQISPTDIGLSAAPDLSRVIKQFKGSITKRLRQSIWQKSFYDEIIRSRNHYLAARRYIAENPLRWEYDCGDPGDFDAYFSEITE